MNQVKSCIVSNDRKSFVVEHLSGRLVCYDSVLKFQVKSCGSKFKITGNGLSLISDTLDEANAFLKGYELGCKSIGL